MLICPVCKEKLIKENKTFRCVNNHSFDCAKQGYVNLSRKQTKNHGDNALMVKARTDFLEKDYYDFMRQYVKKKAKGNVYLDAGCGQGYYTKEIYTNKKIEKSEEIRKRVEEARKIQLLRFEKEDISTNSEMNTSQIKKYCILDKECKSFLERVYEKYKLNIRTYNNILKIARTIADLSNNERIDVSCIAEAIQYKVDNKFYKKEV